MIKYTIFSDYHLGHPFALKPNFKFGRNIVFLGDNFDIKNNLKSEISNIIKQRKEIIEKCRKSGGIYLSGNHSLIPLKNKKRLIAVRNNILFLHGDIIQWGKAAVLYRSLFSPGRSKFYWTILKYWRKLHPGNCSKLKKRQINAAVNLAKQYHCKTIVIAHFHPEKIIDMTKEGIRIIVVPRGKITMLL